MIKMRNFINKRVSRVPERFRLPIALGFVVAFSLTLTAISVFIYNDAGFAKLDLSRPGFEHEREEVRATETQKTYDTTSPVTKGSIDEFLKEYDSRNRDLKEYGDFNDQALSDVDLQITASDSTASR